MPVPGCTTTAYTAPVIQAGPTSIYYSLTTYTSSVYDCHGCEDIIVLPYGHIFPVRFSNKMFHFPFLEESQICRGAYDNAFQEAIFTTTVTAPTPTTMTIARCSLSHA
jgi:hypothetical protein